MSQDSLFCYICGVAFATYRIRTRDEPPEDAWGYRQKDDNGRHWIGGMEGSNARCTHEGCSVCYRGPAKHIWGEAFASRNLDEELSDDGTYVYESEPEDEPLEHASDDGDESQSGSPERLEDEEMKVADEARPEELDGEHPWTFTVHPEIKPGPFQPISILRNLEYVERPDRRIYENQWKYMRQWEYEHIAGPHCEQVDGYNGNYISAAEMRGCTTIQCLVAKKADWQPEDDDEEFERNSRFHLTGLAGFEGHEGELHFTPVRHGASRVVASHFYDMPQLDENDPHFGVAFHPACFELFKVASIQAFGRVEVDKLVRCRLSYRGQYPEDQFCERDGAILGSRSERYWMCRPHCEFLAANPAFIPGVREFCETAICRDDGFDVQQSPFKPRDASSRLSTAEDGFLTLPREILLMITDLLKWKDIARLRLVSRAFEHLPISLWYRLLRRDFPFFYEAWSTDVEPYKWATLDPEIFVCEKKAAEEFQADQEVKRQVIKTFEPAILDAWEADQPTYPPVFDSPEHQQRKKRNDDHYRSLQPISLPYVKTNWYKVYGYVRKHRRNLKGLDNRERIWKDLTRLLRKMGEF